MNIKIIGLGIVIIVLIAFLVLLFEPGTKEPVTETNQSLNVEDKETNINITNKENLSYNEKHQNTLSDFGNNSNVKRYVYKTLKNYTITLYVTNLSTSDKKRYLIYTIDNFTKNHIVLRIEDNNVHLKVTHLASGREFERDYKTINWNNKKNINVEDIKDVDELVFSFDILYFQDLDLKNIEKCNLTGIKNLKIIKTECSNKTEEVLVSNPHIGSRKITVYNCTSFYDVNYVGKVNNKIIINKSWIENESCRLSKPETGCRDTRMLPYSEKMYFAGTENFNGKKAYKIIYEKFIYEKFKNFSEISVWHFVDIFLIDKKGILLKATAKSRWITNGVPEEFFTDREIVLEKELTR